MRRVVIVGGGFAGVWAALGAAGTRRRHPSGQRELAITLVSRDPWLTIRPRLYESSLDDVRVPLDAVTGPAGVERVEGEVSRLDVAAGTITIDGADGVRGLRYDRLVLAAGSRMDRPAIPGAERADSIDTYAEAAQLHRHIAGLTAAGDAPGRDARFTAVVVGAGFTGIELATELITKLRALAEGTAAGGRARVLLLDRAPGLAPDLSPDARRHVEKALTALGIEVRLGITVSAIRPGGVLLGGGEWIPAATTVWTAGFRASGLAAQLPVEHDETGRVPVDAFLRVRGVDRIYAAGDVAHAMADADHVAPMSCQHAIPMGERAGGNAVAELLGLPPEPYRQPHYVTCLDLGEAGALFTEGWNREVKLTGFWARVVKQAINTRLIYPPRATRRGALPAEKAPLTAASGYR